MHRVHCVLLLALGSIGLTASCAYHYYAGNLRPMDEAVQGEDRRVTDDGSVIFTAGTAGNPIAPHERRGIEPPVQCGYRAGDQPLYLRPDKDLQDKTRPPTALRSSG